MRANDLPAREKRPRAPSGLTEARRRQRRNMAEVAQGWDQLEDWERNLTKLQEWRRLKSAPYQVPLDGSRICIRTWPQDHGWKGKGLLQVSHALVPRSS